MKGGSFVVWHPSLSYFARDYGLEQISLEYDGKEVPVGRVNYVLRALQLPAGEHTVVFRFDPQSVHATETVAYASVVLIYLALIGAFLLLGKGNCCKKEE